ncbi:Alcohol-forming fatty acyl-CoA reductase [Bienertia sinuspersici]
MPIHLANDHKTGDGVALAKLYGWPNTYVFTKAMGEMLVGQLRGNLPVVIMRPTIVCSTLMEPFPGWVEGCRTIDSVAIPADMFVNSIIVAMKAHINDPNLTIYQVGSSHRNPVTFNELREFHYAYFTKNPWTDHEVTLNFQQMLFNLQKKLKIATKLVDLYKPYLFFKACNFTDTNSEKLLTNAREKDLDEEVFNFDPLCVNWEDYFINIHLPAIVKYLF